MTNLVRRQKLETRFAVLGALLLAFVLACSDGRAEQEPEPTPLPGTTRITIVNAEGKEHRLDVEIADSAQERTVGLSGRTELPENAGMLFVFTQRGRGFWMKDTFIPLSVAFIGSCGEIVHIADMQPQTLTLHNTDQPYSFGLEVSQGWFRERGIAGGSKVKLPPSVVTADCG